MEFKQQLTEGDKNFVDPSWLFQKRKRSCSFPESLEVEAGKQTYCPVRTFWRFGLLFIFYIIKDNLKISSVGYHNVSFLSYFHEDKMQLHNIEHYFRCTKIFSQHYFKMLNTLFFLTQFYLSQYFVWYRISHTE